MQRMGAELGQTANPSTSLANAVASHLAPSCQTPSSAVSPAETNSGGAITLSTTQKRELGLRPVYNLTVEGAHTYYANGVLTHNCDSLAWAVQLALGRQPPRSTAPTQKIKSWRDRINGNSAGSYMSA